MVKILSLFRDKLCEYIAGRTESINKAAKYYESDARGDYISE